MQHVARVGLVVFLVGTALAAQSATARPDVPAAAQPNAPAAVQLVGRVTSAGDGQPLRRALITATVGGRLRSKALTDNDGRYQMEIPPDVSYSVTIAKSSYLTTSLQRPAARASQGTLDVSLARGAVISGRVIDPGGHPVVSIRVQLTRGDGRAPNSSDITVTDDTGAFRIAGLEPGKYTLTTVSRPEYPSGTDATMRRPTGREETWQPSSDAVSIDVTAGAERDVALVYKDPAVVLSYALVGGTVSGRVTDDAGEPAAGLIVQLHRIDVATGRPVSQPYAAARITDDRGQYRLFHIKAGRYVLVVTDQSTFAPGYGGQASLTTGATGLSWLPVYYPGTVTPSNALALTIGRRQEIGGADVAFTHTEGARVFGTALNAAGQPLRSRIGLFAANSEGTVMPPTRDLVAGVDGSFAFDAVPPGEYAVRSTTAVSSALFTTADGRLFASNPTPPAEAQDPEFAMQRMLVSDADMGPLVIRTLRPATLRGRIVFEGGSPIESQPDLPPASQSPVTLLTQPGAAPPPPTGPITAGGVLEIVGLTTDPLFDNSGVMGSGTVSSAKIDRKTWTFELPRLLGAVRLRVSGVPPEVWLKSAYVGSTNLAETAFTFQSADDSHDDVTIVLASTAATVTGTTTGSDARPLPGAQVVVFSTNRERWYTGSPSMQHVFSGEDSRFKIASLPPGDYWIVAIESDENEFAIRRESERVELLESLIARARRITLADGQTATVSPRAVALGK